MADESVSNPDSGSGGGGHDDFDIELPLSSSEGGQGQGAGQGSGAGSQSQAQAAPPSDAAQAQPGASDPNASALPPDLTEALRREGLRPVPGETPTAAYSRLTHHLSGKSRDYGRQLREMRDQHAASLADLRAGLEPMLRDYYQNQRLRQLEEQEAQIPPKDSPEYQVWLQEQVLARLEAKEREEFERAQEMERLQGEQATQEQLAAIDATGYSRVAEGLGLVQGSQPDPEFAHAYDIFSNAAISAARGYFPEASDQQIQEFVALSQRLDIRRAEMNGVDIREVMKQRLNGMVEALVAAGIVQRSAKKELMTGESNGTGTSSGKPAPTTTPQPTAAQRVAAEAAAGARRAPLATPSATRPTQLPGQLPDPANFEDDDAYVEAALAGILGNEEQRVAGHRKQR
jgi:hypothetical protein